MAASDSTVTNKSWFLKEYPKGLPQESQFELRESQISTKLSEGSDDVLVKVLYLSLDPYMRGRMKAGGSGYAQGFSLDKPLVGGAVGVVASSANPKFKAGDYVLGSLGWELFTLVPKGQGLRPIDPKGLPLSYFLGVLGMTGLTAYCGLFDIGDPKEGETVYVSAASGAVGQIVGQLAKIKGAHVVGSAGSAEKVELLKSTFGYDTAFNYKDEPDLVAALKKHCPKGIDVYFENVGGAMLEAVLANANVHARIPVCGMISQYNLEEGEGIHGLIQLIAKRIKMQGFLVGDYMTSPLAKSFPDDVSKWLKEGKIKYVEDVSEGLESAPKAFIGLLQGHNVGKLVVHVADDDRAPGAKTEK